MSMPPSCSSLDLIARPSCQVAFKRFLDFFVESSKHAYMRESALKSSKILLGAIKQSLAVGKRAKSSSIQGVLITPSPSQFGRRIVIMGAGLVGSMGSPLWVVWLACLPS